uniref:Uncharacterized protein n=1 Tax=Rhizophora mucronata TaxID=61149 RepID=A0A2P2K822_RHIMU
MEPLLVFVTDLASLTELHPFCPYFILSILVTHVILSILVSHMVQKAMFEDLKIFVRLRANLIVKCGAIVGSTSGIKPLTSGIGLVSKAVVLFAWRAES